jgi:hypothetical protein
LAGFNIYIIHLSLARRLSGYKIDFSNFPFQLENEEAQQYTLMLELLNVSYKILIEEEKKKELFNDEITLNMFTLSKNLMTKNAQEGIFYFFSLFSLIFRPRPQRLFFSSIGGRGCGVCGTSSKSSLFGESIW